MLSEVQVNKDSELKALENVGSTNFVEFT